MRVVQISDTHLYADSLQTLLKLNTQQSLEAVVELLHADPRKPDVIILTGDLSQDNSGKAYERILDIFGGFLCPIYWIPGNHDEPALLTSTFAISKFKSEKVFSIENWLFVLLNSHYPGHVSGLLSRAELSRLEHYLHEHSGKNTLIFLHHPPLPFGSAWLDQSRLINGDALFNIVDKHSSVRAILCGHVHQAYETYRESVSILSAPSTCIQFLPHSQKFALDTLAPGYRWLELHSSGTFKTGIERVKDFESTVDFTASGY